MAAIDRIRAKFPDAELIMVADAGQFFGQSPAAAVKLAQRGRFPVRPRKINNKWMVNVEALAAFIDSPGDDEQGEASVYAPPPRVAAKKAQSQSGRDHNKKTEKLPSMADALLAIRRGIEEKQAEMDLLLAVFDELERQENREAAGDPPSAPRDTL